MNIYLSESGAVLKTYIKEPDLLKEANILQSFFYADEFTENVIIPNAKRFILDSGAFTFMMNQNSEINWDSYLTEYANYIRRNNIQNFFELDIDNIVGFDKVIELRQKLEYMVGKKCIPVWHKSRGIDNFLKMCEEYSYAAVGGIAIKVIKPEQYKFLPWFIRQAHIRGCKLHGLGFTSLKWLPACHFDSVDSTAWTGGNRFGYIYYFNGRTMEKIYCPDGKRIRDSRSVALINYKEWIKFQKYAKERL